MSTTIVLILVTTFGVAISRLVGRFASRHLILSGVEFVAIGVLVGPHVTGLLTPPALSALQPFVSLTLGLVGFLIGLPLRRQLRRAAGLEAGLLAALIVGGVVGVACFGVVRLAAPDLTNAEAAWLALAMGAAAAVMSGQVVEAGVRVLGTRGPASDLLHAFSLASNVLAVCVFGLALAFARSDASSESLGLTRTEWLMASIAVGIACGILFRLFSGEQERGDRVFLATVSVVIFASGMAAGMGVSPLLITGVAGLTVSMLYSDTYDLHGLLAPLEGPAYVVLMIFAGALWSPVAGWGWVLPGVYVAARYAALRAGVAAALWIVPGVARPYRLGHGLWAQGGLAVALAVNYAQVDAHGGALALTAVLIGVLVTDLTAAPMLRRTLADAGEMRAIGEVSP